MLPLFILFKVKSKKQRGHVDTKTELLKTYREQEKEYSEDIQLLQQYIKEKNHAKKKQLSSSYMSLEEGEERLQSSALGARVNH